MFFLCYMKLIIALNKLLYFVYFANYKVVYAKLCARNFTVMLV
jgi:hypothetical protein